jgi:hypothetical protein
MRTVELPRRFRQVQIWGDHDTSGAGQEAAAEAAKRLRAEGRAVVVLIPPKAGTDWLDVLVEQGADALRSALRDARPEPVEEEGDWPPPVPFEDFDLPGFPADALSRQLRAYVEAEAEATQTPVDMVAWLTLSAVALACAKKVAVMVKPGWVEGVNIYTLTALESGNRKSAVVTDVNAPIRLYEAELVRNKTPEIAVKQSALNLLKAKYEATKRAAVGPKTPAEKVSQYEQVLETLAKQLAEMYVPSMPRLLVDDVTAEKLAMVLAEQGGRIALISSEGEIFAIMAGLRYSDTGSPNFGIYLVAHSGENFLADRVNRPSVVIKLATLTVGLTVQPGVVRRLADKLHFREQGLLARFWYCIPWSKLGFRKTKTAEPVPDSVAAVYAEKITALLKLEDQFDSADLEQRWPVPRKLKLSPEALDAHWAFAEWVEPQFLPGGELANMTDWGEIGRWCPQACRSLAHVRAR